MAEPNHESNLKMVMLISCTVQITQPPPPPVNSRFQNIGFAIFQNPSATEQVDTWHVPLILPYGDKSTKKLCYLLYNQWWMSA